MTMASDIKSLGEDILSSFNDRVKFVTDLKKETANSLASAESDRLKEFKEFMKGIAERQREREKEVGDLLHGFRAELREMANTWQQMTHKMQEKRKAVSGRA
ncbi:MAG: hypothetical protein Q8J64_10235 [Thermodesulfovibrionales bacterium]|nr:hypothetical protein [Thermodesulfovibrionales bacterium]